jgi:hypothetical protein
MLLAAPDKASTGFKGGVVAALFFRHPSNQRRPHSIVPMARIAGSTAAGSMACRT